MKDLYRVVIGFKDCDMDVSRMIKIIPIINRAAKIIFHSPLYCNGIPTVK
jgi:hypothetical protein